jgi:CHAT domain-containing protein
LPDPQSPDDSPVPVMVDHQVTYQPSASTLATLRNKIESRQPASKMLAVFADPIFERDDSRLIAAKGASANDSPEQSRTETYRALRDVGVAGDGRSIPRLFASRDEANAIMAVTSSTLSLKAIGFEANKGLATGPELSQYRIIHFATHGVLDSETPELSGLVLSLFDKDGQPQDGFLRLNDIYNLDLPADLVVLSACNSALGKQIKGEGLIGLTRGFMYAGAARVMASLWKVDDEATAELIKHFYQEMLAEKKAPAEALRQAQIAMWQQNRWRSPYFWAPFVLQGEYKGAIDAGQRPQRGEYYPAILAAVITAILVLSLYAARLVVMKRQRPV